LGTNFVAIRKTKSTLQLTTHYWLFFPHFFHYLRTRCL
jgi:hypothetical protein